jgi:hypothetical protein
MKHGMKARGGRYGSEAEAMDTESDNGEVGYVGMQVWLYVKS